MSVQFGKWNFDAKAADAEQLARVESMLAPYGPDRATFYSKGGVDILYHAFHTTRESCLEIQPEVLESGAVLTWDGRLDNRSELIRLLHGRVAGDSTDLAIVARSYERWGTESFGKLLGDWALSVWNPREGTLLLAKDPIGVRHLYYTRDSSEFTWSTILDPLVLFSRKSFEIEEEYIAGWLSNFPAPHLTPYRRIYSVPPSSFVRVDIQRIKVVKYWDLDPSRHIHYQKDADYEEHFRNVFTTSVGRRLRSNAPVLAELSGGIDSSSIVCVADLVIGQAKADTPRLHTLSYYDDSEPNWNERPYFTIVEDKRGQKGSHIDLASDGSFRFETKTDRFLSTPGARGRSAAITKQLAATMGPTGTRVVLSGVGGDEFTGGLPTPVPELADLLARARCKRLANQLRRWALEKRKPWMHVLSETLKRFLPAGPVGVAEFGRPAPWLRPAFVARQQAALTGYEERLRLFGPLPSFQEFQSTLKAVRRQLGCASLSPTSLSEKRYPYLDRELLEFLCAIPREQLVRPGERRSLIRRALVGIVPNELLNRRRKAFVARGPRLAIAAEWDGLAQISQDMISASLGIVDPSAFQEALERARSGERMSIVPVLRTIEIESWLRNVYARKTFDGRPPNTAFAPSAVGDGLEASLHVARRLGSQLRRADR